MLVAQELGARSREAHTAPVVDAALVRILKLLAMQGRNVVGGCFCGVELAKLGRTREKQTLWWRVFCQSANPCQVKQSHFTILTISFLLRIMQKSQQREDFSFWSPFCIRTNMACLRRFHVLTGEEILQKLSNYPESLEVKLEYLGGIGIGLCHGGFMGMECFKKWRSVECVDVQSSFTVRPNPVAHGLASWRAMCNGFDVQ